MTSTFNETASLVPLFVTRGALSRRSAIGVQTIHFVNACDQWRHLYWSTYDLRATHPWSRRLETLLFGRFSFFKRSSAFNRCLAGIGFSWWRGNLLKQRHIDWLHGFTRNVGACYLSPIDKHDATRMRQLVQLIDRPFVLHLWDVLDGHIDVHGDLGWLLENARHVYGLPGPMIDDLKLIRPDARALIFYREETPHRAKPHVAGTPLRVALIGEVSSYRDGVGALVDARRILAEAGIEIQIVYVGAPSILAQLDEALTESISATGFLESDDMRDTMLASCHVAFLPGPWKAPEKDARSKYSIPSRILDFLAVRLPIVGSLHANSAAARFGERLGLGDALRLQDSVKLADTLASLMEAVNWTAASFRSERAAAMIASDPSPREVASVLASIGAM